MEILFWWARVGRGRNKNIILLLLHGGRLGKSPYYYCYRAAMEIHRSVPDEFSDEKLR